MTWDTRGICTELLDIEHPTTILTTLRCYRRRLPLTHRQYSHLLMIYYTMSILHVFTNYVNFKVRHYFSVSLIFE